MTRYLLLITLCCPSGLAQALESVTLNLRWHHQFQFAGYYAAIEQGYYHEAGFEVTLVEGQPGLDVMSEVLEGRADFGISSSELVLARLRGKPVVALAAIYQHSPSVLVALRESGINRPADLAGRTVATLNARPYANYIAMFEADGLQASSVRFKPSPLTLDDLISGKIDAQNVYLTAQIHQLEKQGIDYTLLNPRDYGIDTYSDFLFARQQDTLWEEERLQRFRDASIRGWTFAIQHPQQLVHLIKGKYGSPNTLDALRFEALASHELVSPGLVDIGYIKPDRLQRMAQIYVDQGLVDNTQLLPGFVLDAEKAQLHRAQLYMIFLFVIVILLCGGIFVFYKMTHRLRGEIRERKKVEQQLRHLSDTDALTQLYNRRAFSRDYAAEVDRCHRYAEHFCVIMLDIDHFKSVNDSHGHDVGDQVLVAIATCLSDNVRSSDVCARYGGEEFVILLPKTPLQEAAVFADRLRQLIEATSITLPNEKSLSVTTSLGVAQWHQGNDDVIVSADQHLYQAKSSGRNRVCC